MTGSVESENVFMTRHRWCVLLRVFLVCLLLSGCGKGVSHPALEGAQLPGLIPIRQLVETLQDNGDYQVSPDGKKLAWRSTADGRGVVRVRSAAGGVDTVIPVKPSSFTWAADSRNLVMLISQAGDENFHLWVSDASDEFPIARDLTPYPRVKTLLVGVPRTAAGTTVLVRHNQRQESVFDLYQIDLKTGKSTLLATNPGNVTDWIADRTGSLRARVVQVGETRTLQRAPDFPEGAWTAVTTWDALATLNVLGFTPDGSSVWVVSNTKSDKIELRQLDLATGKQTLVYADSDADLDVEANIPVIGPRSGSPLLAVSEPNYPRTKVFNPQLVAALEKVRGTGPARVRLISIDDQESRATVSVFNGLFTRHFLLDIDTASAELLSEDSFAPLADKLSNTSPVSFKSRDGLQLHGYLTLPKGVPEGRKLPMVVRVHGGPWYRNIWGNTDFLPAAAQVQFLANRGYAVLEVNFRGSTGYGRKFMEAAIGEFGGAMQLDLLDGVNWAVSSGFADASKVAIMGTSYGGYAALSAMTTTPEVFVCGVAIAAPTDLAKLIESFPGDWSLDMVYWTRYVGDPLTAQDRAVMATKSPIAHASRLNKPLLLVHGQNDPRVRVSQADAFVSLLKQEGKPVDYMVLPREGHFIGDWRSNFRMYRKIEDFLATCLGGRSAGLVIDEMKARF